MDAGHNINENMVLCAISENPGYLSCSGLTDYTGHTFMELAPIIDALVKEGKINVLLNISPDLKVQGLSRQYAIFAKFRSLVALHVTRERQAKFYASMLCITPKYLSTIIKKVSGKTVNAWIDEEAMKLIKIRLLNSVKTIKEIAFEFNFPSISSFGKYFKTQTGVSPLYYRKSRQNITSQQ